MTWYDQSRWIRQTHNKGLEQGTTYRHWVRQVEAYCRYGCHLSSRALLTHVQHVPYGDRLMKIMRRVMFRPLCCTWFFFASNFFSIFLCPIFLFIILPLHFLQFISKCHFSFHFTLNFQMQFFSLFPFLIFFYLFFSYFAPNLFTNVIFLLFSNL